MYTLIRVSEGILSNSVFRYIGDQTHMNANDMISNIHTYILAGTHARS